MTKFILKYRFWFITVAIILMFFIGLKACTKPKSPPKKLNSSLSVTVVKPQTQALEAHLHLSGMTVARETVLVVSELSGLRIQEKFADVGQKVKKGQLLATLNRESLTHQVNQLSNEYLRVLDEYQRIEKLKAMGAISQQLLVQKKAETQIAKAKLEDAQLNLSRTHVIAPKEGIIFESKAALGDAVNTSQPLYRIAHGDIEFQADVPEANLGSIQLGQAVKLVFSGHPEVFSGKVRLIEPNINYSSRTAVIRIALDKAPNFPIGLFGQAEIATTKVEGFVLPDTALQQDSMGTYVWALDKNNKAFRIPVTIKLRSNGHIVVDPFDNHNIVAKAGAFVKKGDLLQVVEG